MTADELEAKDIADAQEAKDIADAQAAKQAEIDAAAGVGGGASGSDLWGAGKSLVRGAGRGFASIPDAPAALYTGVKNIPKRAYNTFGGERPVESDDHGDAPVPVAVQPTEPAQPLTYPQAPSKENQLPLDVAPKTPISQAYDASFPVDLNHPYADMVGQVAGPAIVEAAATGGGSLLTIPGAIKATARTGVTTGGTLTGSAVGGELDKLAGGTGDWGSIIGGGFGGGSMPAIIAQTPWKYANRKFVDAETADKLAAVDRLNQLLPPEHQIPVSAGLIGNDKARRTEDFTASVAGGGGPAYDTRTKQYVGIDAAGQKIAENMRDAPSDTKGITKASIGQKVRDTAAIADEAAKIKANAAMDPMAEQVGRDLPIDQTAQLDQMETIRRGSQPQYRAPVQNEIDKINSSRFDTEGPNTPKVVDPGLEAQLQMRINQAQRRLDGANSAENAKAAQDELSSLQAQQAANRGQTFQDTIESRSRLGDRIEGQIPLDAAQTTAVKNSQTAAMKKAAELAGVPGEEFDAAFGEYGRIQDQRAILDKLANMQGQGKVYNQLFSETGTHDLDTLQALNEHAADPLRSALADQFERKMRGVGAGLPPRSDTIGAQMKKGPDWWTQIPPETRQMTVGGGSLDPRQAVMNYDDAAALSDVMRADSERPQRTQPGSTNIQNNSNVYRRLAGAGAGFALGSIPGAIAGILAPATLAKYAGKAMTNDRIVRRVIDPGSWSKGQSLSRILAASVASGGPMNYRPSPIDEEGAH